MNFNMDMDEEEDMDFDFELPVLSKQTAMNFTDLAAPVMKE